MDKIKTIFPYLIVATIVGLTIVSKSVPMAYAAILGMGFILGNNLVEKIKLSKEVKVGIPEEMKRKIQDLEARTVTLEYGVKARGF